MPRDLFGDVTSPSITLGTRKWYSVPLSFLVHALVMGVFVVVPLLATGVLPMPNDPEIVPLIAPPPLPQPPPVRLVRPTTPQAADQNAAPVVEPDTIREEPKLELGFEKNTTPGDPLVGAGIVEGSDVVAAPPAVVRPPSEPQKPVPVGGHIQPPDRVSYVSPVYPPIALAARVHGIVIIQATIDVQGRVQEATVLRSASPLFNDAALAAVRQWVYRPTLLNGIPVSVVMTVTVQFKMQ